MRSHEASLFAAREVGLGVCWEEWCSCVGGRRAAGVALTPPARLGGIGCVAERGVKLCVAASKGTGRDRSRGRVLVALATWARGPIDPLQAPFVCVFCFLLVVLTAVPPLCPLLLFMSCTFVPACFSPLQCDANGKTASWETVVKIPFIDERDVFGGT